MLVNRLIIKRVIVTYYSIIFVCSSSTNQKEIKLIYEYETFSEPKLNTLALKEIGIKLCQSYAKTHIYVIWYKN